MSGRWRRGWLRISSILGMVRSSRTACGRPRRSNRYTNVWDTTAAADKKADKLARKKKHTGCKGEKGAAGCKGCAKAKASLALSHCTCCKKRCPLSKPKCGKGRRLAAALKLREKKA